MAKFTVPNQTATREEWLHCFARAARVQFADAGAPIDQINIRISVGFPSSGRRSNAIGECFHSSASEDGAREIFIRPSLQSDVVEIAAVLTHELVHAALPDGEGHGKTFGKVARALGLEGKLTSTTGGEAWKAWAQPILDAIGPFPGAAIKDGVRAAGSGGKQTTRLIKCECTECGLLFRTTRKWFEKVGEFTCPDSDCGGTVTVGG